MDATAPPPFSGSPSGTGPPARRSTTRILPSAPLAALVTIVSFTVLLYVIELVDWASRLQLDQYGIAPRSLGGLDGVLWAPLLHGSWGHLLANTLPFLVFGFLVMAGGIGQFVMVTALIWIVSGLGVWLIAPSTSVTVGMSGVIFGWLVFLLARGFFARSVKQILLAVVLFLIWGSVLLGVIPASPQVSWQGHLFGALAGLLAAWLVARADRDRTPGVAA